MESIALNKQNRIKILKKNRGDNFISNPSKKFDNFPGLIINHPPPPPLPTLSSAHQYGQQNQQPPLLPLPNVSAIHHQPTLMVLSRKNRTRTARDMSLKHKKSAKPTKREEVMKNKRATQSISEFLIVASDRNSRGTNYPNELLPNHLPVVLKGKGLLGTTVSSAENNTDMFSGWVFNDLSPPPSSLPLPKFSLRSKLGCNAEASDDIDAGATDNLRRLLRIR